MPASAKLLEAGSELPALKKTITQRQIDCYSGVRPKSIHTDVEWAKAKGFPAPLAQALMSTAYVSQMMVAWLGKGFVQGGKISASFIKPVIVGDTLTARAVVKSHEEIGGRPHVTVECWCENQQGVKTLVGSASGFADHLRA
ncbi:MAG TPA: MaoC family dehydratase [Burkholderiales bacterium]|nr:MaoC family dehydratase [Burkholderiales bacterium]